MIVINLKLYFSAKIHCFLVEQLIIYSDIFFASVLVTMINVWFTSEGSQFFLDTLFIICFEYLSSALPSYFIPCTISPEIHVVMIIGYFCGSFFLKFFKVNPNAKNTILHIHIFSRYCCVILEFHKYRFLFRYLYLYIRTGSWIVHFSQTVELFLSRCMFFYIVML